MQWAPPGKAYPSYTVAGIMHMISLLWNHMHEQPWVCISSAWLS